MEIVQVVNPFTKYPFKDLNVKANVFEWDFRHCVMLKPN